MTRRQCRKHIFKLLYEVQFHQDEPIKDLVDTYLENFKEEEEELTENDYRFILGEIEGVCKVQAQIDQDIETAVKGWKLNRLSKVDLAILRLAVYEITCVPDIPTSVSINEAVELAKKYSQPAARAFINGVLGALAPREEA